MKKNFFQISIFQILLLIFLSVIGLAADTFRGEILGINSIGELVEPQHKGKYIYPPAYAFDDDKSTAWAYHGIKGGIMADLVNDIQFDEIQIINGFAKDERLYINNNRIKKIKIMIMNISLSVSHEKNEFLKDSELSWQSIKLNRTVIAKTFYFLIEDIYKGKYNDTCISEIRFLFQGVPIPLTNIRSIVDSQKEGSLKKVEAANESMEKYFLVLYGTNRFSCKEQATSFLYTFLPDWDSSGKYYDFKNNKGNYVIRKAGSAENRGSFQMKGNYLTLFEDPNYSYFKHSMKLHIKIKDLDTIYINDNRCDRLEDDDPFTHFIYGY